MYYDTDSWDPFIIIKCITDVLNRVSHRNTSKCTQTGAMSSRSTRAP